MNPSKRFASQTHSSQSKIKNPANLREKLQKMNQAISTLQQDMAQEVNVNQALENQNTKVKSKQNYQTLSRQIQALKSAFQGLSDNVVAQLDTIRKELLSEVRQDFAAIQPKVKQHSFQIQSLTHHQGEHTESLFSIRRQLNEKHSALQQKTDYILDQIKQIRNSQHQTMLELAQTRRQIKKIQSFRETDKEHMEREIKKMKEFQLFVQSKHSKLESMYSRLQAQVDFFQKDTQRKFDTLQDSLSLKTKELKAKFMDLQSELGEQSNFFHQSKTRLEQQTGSLAEQISQIRQTLSSQIEEQGKLSFQSMENLKIEFDEVKEQFSKLSSSEIKQLGENIDARVDQFQKSVLKETYVLSEKVFNFENELDCYKREVSVMINSVQENLDFKGEFLSSAIEKVCDMARIANPLTNKFI